MGPETKICQNCKNQFIIEPDDFAFYEKIRVPPPTWCPECRAMRRMSFMTDRILFKRTEEGTGKEILSVYPRDVSFPVYDETRWWSDGWDPLAYGLDYNPQRSFWEQLRALHDAVPRRNLSNLNSVRCAYCPGVTYSKDCYLTIGFEAEGCLYGYYCRKVAQCVDFVFLVNCERCYESMYLRKCSNVSFSYFSSECRDAAFLYDCKNCSDCFMCAGLRNKRFHFLNAPYSEAQYREILARHRLNTFSGREEVKRQFQEFILHIPRRHARLLHSYGSTGDNLQSCNNCRSCFDVDSLRSASENSKYIVSSTAIRDSQDVTDTGEESELCYESTNTWGSRIVFCSEVIQSSGVQYSCHCHNSENLFGCFGLRKKRYCILNKQYTKEQYNALVPKIIEHMNRDPYRDRLGRIYRYGEFFPVDFSAMDYNNSVAYRWFPISKERAFAEGYHWRDPDTKQYVITKFSQDLPNDIKDVGDSILKETIGCAHEGKCNHQCATAFKIIPEELRFYREMEIALPRLCPNCRHYERLELSNPPKLWRRRCMCDKPNHAHDGHCTNEFETSYAPDRKEIVYCEQCYNAEVV